MSTASARSVPGLRDLARLDPASVEAEAAVSSLLGRPRPIDEVEEIEVLVKRQWAEILRRAPFASEQAFAFSRFFKTVGFIRKYKPYGTKFAAPFGYSIFDLRNGRGFSIQLHRVAKIEAFHILSRKRDAFVLLSSLHEWTKYSPQFLQDWSNGHTHTTPLTFDPRPGDVYVVNDLKVVHAIIGCLLEEFATTSNDAVERLHDQNERDVVRIPARHASLARLLAQVADVTPVREVIHTSGRWRTKPLTPPARDLINQPRGGLRGYHCTATANEVLTLDVPASTIMTLACLSGDLEIRLGGGMLQLKPGETAPFSAAQQLLLKSRAQTARVAVAEVAQELALSDLRAP